MQRLLHRWLVEYNPIYLLSAGLVLGGMILCSRGLGEAGIDGQLGVAAIAELYAAALIGGAALLTRIGQRRPAVMLALITVLYQCDLTLHTEACANLGAIGVWASGAWLLLFGAKLQVLAWALKLRLSRSVQSTLLLGALGVAVLPHLLPAMDERTRGAVVALWLCALTSLPSTEVLSGDPGAVVSRVELTPWGHVVLRRAVRASWALSSLLLALHLLFWSSNGLFALGPVLVVAPLLLTRRIRHERSVWCVVIASLVFASLAAPAAFSTTALIAAIVLAVRARAAAAMPERADAAGVVRAAAGPYRRFEADEAAAPAPILLEAVVPGGRAAMWRLVTGAAFALYLSVWTSSWTNGPWPTHLIELDAGLTVLVLLAAWRMKVRLALAPLVAVWVHGVVAARVVPTPRSLVEWGASSVVLGFGLLMASLATSYWLSASSRKRRTPTPGVAGEEA